MGDIKFRAGGHIGRMKPIKLKNPKMANHVPHFGGIFKGDTPGRTDNFPVKVEHGSYIIPSDIVSSLGDGNSLAGGKILDNLTGGPHGVKKSGFSSGGFVPIIVASGEYHVPPEGVAKVGHGKISHGHSVLDSFVKHVREKTIKKLKNLDPPKK